LTNADRCATIKVQKRDKQKEITTMKVWGFNCYGICIKRIEVSKIEEWNATHPLANQKIVSWKE
jgi:hypothetical protein